MSDKELTIDGLKKLWNILFRLEHEQFMDCVNDARELLEQSEPVRHCKWAFNSTRGGVYGRCTSCKEVIYLCGCFNYCPNCGAKVDGETYEANEDEMIE